MSSGSFCREYRPVPPEESSGPATLENEIVYCALCRPDCPEGVMEKYRELGGD